MSDSKDMLILNPDYYSAETSEDDENAKPMFKTVLMQLAFLLVIFAALFFAYSFIIKHNLVSLNSFIPDSMLSNKESINRHEIVIREEPIEIEVPVNKVESAVIVPEKIEEKKKEIKKVEVKKEVESVTPKIIENKYNNDDLTDEYINLIKKSLGNN